MRAKLVVPIRRQKAGEGWCSQHGSGLPSVARPGRVRAPSPHSSSLRTGKETSSVLMIRLSRVGARKQPHYRVVVIEKERARNGRPVEIVGTYNPRTTPASVELKRERIDYWRSNGAQVSARVGKILGFPAAAAPAETAAS